MQSSLLRLHIFKVKGCLKWNLFFLIYRSCLHLALHSSLTTCAYLLFKRERLTIAVLLQNCPVYAVLPGGEEPFILASFWHPTPAAEGEAAVEFASRRWRCLRTVGGGESRGVEAGSSQSPGKMGRLVGRRKEGGGLSNGSGHCSDGSRSMNGDFWREAI